MSAQGTFATVFNCMDGRCQKPVFEWCQTQFGVSHVDTITLPGMDKQLAEHDYAQPQMVYIKDTMAKISVEGHGSRHAVVVGHRHCAGNPVSDEQHREDVKNAAAEIQSWGMYEKVVGLYAHVEDDGCDLEEVV